MSLLQSMFSQQAELEYLEYADQAKRTLECKQVLHAGNLDEALRLLQAGIAEGGISLKEILSVDCKPYSPAIRSYTDIKRRKLMEAVVAQSSNPAALISEDTIHTAIHYGRTTLIPYLIGLGAKVTDADFAAAAAPWHAKDQALPLLQALLPHVNRETVIKKAQVGGGVAELGNYEAFLWLESEGLVGNTHIMPPQNFSYAHDVAMDWQRDSADDRARLAQHLVDENYPIDALHHQRTPTYMAINHGRLDLAKIYLEGGAKPDPAYMTQAVGRIVHNRLSADEAIDFMSYLHKDKHIPYPEAAMMEAYKTIAQDPQKYTGSMGQIIEFLSAQGVKPKDQDLWAFYGFLTTRKIMQENPHIGVLVGLNLITGVPAATLKAPAGPSF